MRDLTDEELELWLQQENAEALRPYLLEAVEIAVKLKAIREQHARENVGADDCDVEVWDCAVGMAGGWGPCKYAMNRSDRCRKHGGRGDR